MFSHPHLIFRFGFPINSQSIGFLANKFKFNKSESWKVVNKEKSFFIFAAATVRARRKWSYKASAKSSAKLNQTRGSSNICFFCLVPISLSPLPLPSFMPAFYRFGIKLLNYARLVLFSDLTSLFCECDTFTNEPTDGHSSQAAGEYFLLIHSTMKTLFYDEKMKKSEFIDFDRKYLFTMMECGEAKHRFLWNALQLVVS